MALNPNNSAAEGMFKAVKDSEGIFGATNKVEDKYPAEENKRENEYTLKMSDEDVLDLIVQWKSNFRKYDENEGISKSQDKSFNYWLGKQTGDDLTLTSSTSDPSALVDNIIFTMIETLLPMVTRANPDPVVSCDQTPAGEELSHIVSATLVYEADRQQLRRKLARVLRRWSWDRLGVMKVNWNTLLKKIETNVVIARNLILDPDGYIDESGRFVGNYIGEKKKETASRLIEMFADGDAELKSQIKQKCDNKLSTKLEYIEWWYKGKDLFYTLDDDIVLGKFKNPNWNYDIEEQQQEEENGEVIKFYQPAQEGKNFLDEPDYPYRFLSVFSSGTKPFDETSLILQTIQLQDIVNRRHRQIDKNVNNMNEGLVLSGKSFTTDQASGAANALRKGQAIIVPNGDVRAAATHLPAPSLPGSIFDQLEDMRGEIMNIAGTAGSTPEGIGNEKQVRGKIMVQQSDSSRFANITEALEQLADSIYNLWIQFMFVYYDEEHFVVSSGTQGGSEILAVKNTMFTLVKMIDVTVKEGSLIPKDPLTQRNAAMDLWSANAIDPISFYKKLDEPDPVKASESLILWEMAKSGNMQALQAYLPTLPLFTRPETGGPEGGQPAGTNPTQPQPVTPGSQPAVEAESNQLIKSVPIQNI